MSVRKVTEIMCDGTFCLERRYAKKTPAEFREILLKLGWTREGDKDFCDVCSYKKRLDKTFESW